MTIKYQDIEYDTHFTSINDLYKLLEKKYSDNELILAVWFFMNSLYNSKYNIEAMYLFNCLDNNKKYKIFLYSLQFEYHHAYFINLFKKTLSCNINNFFEFLVEENRIDNILKIIRILSVKNFTLYTPLLGTLSLSQSHSVTIDEIIIEHSFNNKLHFLIRSYILNLNEKNINFKIYFDFLLKTNNIAELKTICSQYTNNEFVRKYSALL